MAMTLSRKYTAYVNALLKASSGFLDRLNSAFDWPEGGAAAGAITVNMLTSVGTTDIADGTILTDTSANTQTDLTFVNKAATITFKPGELRSIERKPDALKAYLVAAADAIRQAGQVDVLADLVAGTPGQSRALPAGQIDFGTDGTSAELWLAINEVDLAIAYIRANTTGRNEDMSIIFPPAAYGNFTTNRQALISGSLLQKDSLSTYQGIPIYSITGPANWGGASKSACFVLHRHCEAFAMEDVYMHGGGVMAASDGTHKMIFVGPYAAGLVNGNLCAEVTNASS